MRRVYEERDREKEKTFEFPMDAEWITAPDEETKQCFYIPVPKI